MAARKPKAEAEAEALVTLVFCPGCGLPLEDASRNVHPGCPEDRRLWVSVPPPS